MGSFFILTKLTNQHFSLRKGYTRAIHKHPLSTENQRWTRHKANPQGAYYPSGKRTQIVQQDSSNKW